MSFSLRGVEQRQEVELAKFTERQKKERLLRLLLEKKKLRGLSDLWFFNKYILGYKDLTDKDRFHGELCKYVESTKKRFVLALEPRGSLKTTCAPIGYALQSIVQDPNIRILIACKEFNLAKKILSAIKGHIEANPEFIKLYGNIAGKYKWSEQEIIVSTRTNVHLKEPTITCAGIDVTKVGNHYDLIFVDDPHDNKNTATREQIEQVKNWYKLLLSLLDPPDSRPKHLPPPRIRITATRWHYDDLSSWIMEQERIREAEGRPKRYHILVKDAILKGELREDMPDEDLLWPERLSADYLLDQKADQGPYLFSCNYRNRPVDDESAMFKRSWVRFYDPETDIDDKELCFSVLDPVRDENAGDWAAIITCSMGRDWVAKIREVRRGKWDEHDTLDQMIRVHRKWKPIKFGVESVAWQKMFARFLKAECRRRGIRIPITELETSTRITKSMRIRSMTPYWRVGLFRVPGKNLEDLTIDQIPMLQGNMAILIDELVRYPRTAKDDCVDALAYMDQLLQRPQVSKLLYKAPAGSFDSIRAKNIGKNKTGVLGTFNVRETVGA